MTFSSCDAKKFDQFSYGHYWIDDGWSTGSNADFRLWKKGEGRGESEERVD